MPLDLGEVAHSTDRPLPTRRPDSEPFWDAAQRGELQLQRCDDCGTFRFYPRPMCPSCHSFATTWTRCSGRGTVYSFTIVRRPLTRWFRDRVPLVCAVVTLEEGPRMMGDLVDVEPEGVRIGDRVHIAFETVTREISLPYFVAEEAHDAPTP
jgi:uncharacterized OB-fold protein